jgi:hypothetical protein
MSATSTNGAHADGAHTCGAHTCGSHAISTLNEGPLHAALKDWYTRPGDQTEVLVDGYLVDIVRDGLLIEIQTRGFSPLKRKLAKLVEGHHVRLVYPIAREKWIVRRAKRGKKTLGRRKSPKRGAVEDIFDELVALPHLLAHRNFALELLLIQEEEIRRHDARRAWRRRGWVTCERRLLDVLDRRLFEGPAAFAAFVPEALDEPFDTAELAAAMARPRRLAQKAAYCLRGMGVIEAVGKRGNAVLYARAAAPTAR